MRNMNNKNSSVMLAVTVGAVLVIGSMVAIIGTSDSADARKRSVRISGEGGNGGGNGGDGRGGRRRRRRR